ncbi:MAG: hypothetical protein Q9227_009435 [Pyrenula ochraceoflavens]
MLLNLLIKVTILLYATIVIAAPATTLNLSRSRDNPRSISQSGPPSNVLRPRDQNAISGDNDGNDDLEDSCPTDDFPWENPPQPSAFPSVFPTAIPSAVPSALSSITTDPQPMDDELGAVCIQQRGLSKRECGTIEFKYDQRDWKIHYNDYPKKDILYIKARSDGKFYASSKENYYVEIRTFEQGRDRFERYSVEFKRLDSDGATVYFVYTKDRTDVGEGRFLRGYDRNGDPIRPKFLSKSGTTAAAPRPNSGGPSSSNQNQLSLRWGKASTDGFTDDEGIPALWNDDTGDGLRRGYDVNGVALTKNWLDRIQLLIRKEDRISMFYTGHGAVKSDMKDFIQTFLRGRGFTYFDVFSGSNENYLIPPQGNERYESYKKKRFMGIYRGSRAVAQMNRSPDIYVIMKWDSGPKKRGRHIFDKPEKVDPNDPNKYSIGVGQVWYWVELPVLLRNPYVKRIHAVQKDESGRWRIDKQWDTMLVLGLTGSIATGKSTVSRILSAPPYSLPIIDADLLARRVVEPGTPGYNKIVEYFSPSTPDLLLLSPEQGESERSLGSPSSPPPLNRAALGRRVFGDAPERRRDRAVLNGIVHPAVRRETYKAILYYYLRGHWAVVLDVPLLFESGTEILCGAVLVVAVSDPVVQMRRLRERDGHLSQEEAENRVLSQGDVKGKARRAKAKGGVGRGYVVWNDGAKGDLEGQLGKVIEDLRKRSPRWWSWVCLLVPGVGALAAAWSVTRAWWDRRKWAETEKREKAKL